MVYTQSTPFLEGQDSYDPFQIRVEPMFDGSSASHVAGDEKHAGFVVEEPAVATIERSTTEPLFHSKKSRYFHGWLVHMPALMTTIVLLIISNLRLFWYSEKGPAHADITPDAINNLLQMVAKIHEIMIIASLAAIGLSMCRRRLVRKGVRLGLLTGGYRVGDLAYLTTGAFWGHGILSGLSLWEVGLASFIVFGTLMSAVIGPASAILLLPTLGWYDLNNAFQKMDLPVIYAAHPDVVWPQILNESLFLDSNAVSDCNTTQSIFTYECPAGGFSDLRGWALGISYTELNNSLTIQHPAIQFRRQVNVTEYKPKDDESKSITLVTSPSSFAMMSLGGLAKIIGGQGTDIGKIIDTHRYELTTNTRMYQPFVQSKCAVYNRNELLKTKKPAYYPADALNCFGDKGCLEVQREKPSFNIAKWNSSDYDDGSMVYMTVPASSDESSSHSVSLFAGLMPYVSEKDEQESWVYACNFLSRWTPSELSIDPMSTDMIKSNLSSAKDLQETFDSADDANSGFVMQIDFAWLNSYLDPEFNMTSNWVDEKGSMQTENKATLPIWELLHTMIWGPTETTPVTYIDLGNRGVEKEKVEKLLARFYGVILTEALARTSSHFDTELILEYTDTLYRWINLKEATGVSDEVYRFTADGIDGNVTRYWSDHAKGEELGSTMRFWHDERNASVPLDFDVRRYGYGSGQQSRTVHFALAIMSLYLGTLAVYALGTLFSRVMEFVRGQSQLQIPSVAAWSDLQDLFVLGMWSQPPAEADLADIGAGANPSSVWNRVVKVRVSKNNNTRHLVLGEKDDMLRPEDAEHF